MKAKFVLISFLLITAVPVTLFGRSEPGTENVPPVQIEATSDADNLALRDVLTAPLASPRGPQEVLKDYQAEMTAITQRFSARVTEIADAVQSGQLSSEQGQKLSTEQYQMAQMQFELLSTWRDMLEQDLARTPSAKPQPIASQASEIVMVALPFSSLELNPSVAEYLGLSASQSRAILQLMSQERRDLQPLMAQLRSTRARLVAATGADEANEKEMKALAANQASLLAKLIVANARMQTKLYKLLTPEQQKKLDDFKQAGEPMIASR